MFCLDHPLAARGLIRATTTCSVHPFARVGERAGGRAGVSKQYPAHTASEPHAPPTPQRYSCCKLRSSSNSARNEYKAATRKRSLLAERRVPPPCFRGLAGGLRKTAPKIIGLECERERGCSFTIFQPLCIFINSSDARLLLDAHALALARGPVLCGMQTTLRSSSSGLNAKRIIIVPCMPMYISVIKIAPAGCSSASGPFA